jgi:hypothetical protein
VNVQPFSAAFGLHLLTRIELALASTRRLHDEWRSGTLEILLTNVWYAGCILYDNLLILLIHQLEPPMAGTRAPAPCIGKRHCRHLFHLKSHDT